VALCERAHGFFIGEMSDNFTRIAGFLPTSTSLAGRRLRDALPIRHSASPATVCQLDRLTTAQDCVSHFLRFPANTL